MALALVALSAVSMRLGLFALFFLFYVGGYPMLQFDVRHYFHLEFIAWWSIGFLIHHVVLQSRAGAEHGWRALAARIRGACEWKRGLKTMASAAAGVVLALWIGRGWQQVSAT